MKKVLIYDVAISDNSLYGLASVTLNKRAIQKFVEMGLNPQITRMGILTGPQSQSKMQICYYGDLRTGLFM